MSNRTYKTAKGTELPLLNLRGRDYLEVKYRLVWFREEHPHWSIETEFVSVTDQSACARAVIRDEQGRVIATSHKFEHERGFPDFMEKAETGAIGRALALIGYGTQFCADELDEGDRIVDSPVGRTGRDTEESYRGIPNALSASSDATSVAEADEEPGLKTSLPDTPDLGEYRIGFGKKYLGKKLKEIPKQDLQSYVAWLERDAAKRTGGQLSREAQTLKRAVEIYFQLDDAASISHAS